MDQRTHDVEEDLKNILQTRLALADKIHTLERRVEETIHTTKAVALEALDVAKDRAANLIESTTQQLNPSLQAARRPWVMIGSAIAVGFAVGLMEQQRRRAKVYRYYPPDAQGADVMPESGQQQLPRGIYPFYGREAPRYTRSPGRSEGVQTSGRMLDVWKPLRDLWQDLGNDLARERSRLQNAALQTGRAFLQDVVRIAGETLLDQISRLGRTAGDSRQRRTRFE